jgi:uncharacterized membrane protein YeiB
MRYPSIDILRMIAIFVMVLVHFCENLAGYTPPFVGFGAPLFAVLSGVSYRLWVNGQQALGRTDEEISKISVRRGLFVLVLGFAFNVFIWLPEEIFNWDVLTFIGAALLLLNFARQLPLPISVLVAVISLSISPLLRGLADYPSYWPNGYFETDLTLTDLWIGFTTTGYFPFFPWIAYSLAGFVTASLLFAEPPEMGDDDAEEPLPSVLPFVICGGTLVSLSVMLLLARPYLPPVISQKLLGGWTMFPPTIEYVLATIGGALFLLGTAHQLVDRNPATLRHTGLLNIAKTFSRYSLTIYVLHHVVHLWPLWIYGMAMGVEPTYFWQQAMSVQAAVAWALVFLAICYFTFNRIGPNERHGIETWMRWLCD